jgi:N-acetylglucosamine repressor
VRKINVSDFTRATRSTPRTINRKIALNLIREHQPISRADLARRMKVGRSLVTALVRELLLERSIYEGVTADVPRGRKPKMLHVRTEDRLVVAVDVRYSRTSVMLTDFDGTEIALEVFETVFDPGELIDKLVVAIRRLLRSHDAFDKCEGIGVVLPGMVDGKTKRILNSPQLGWRDVDIHESLAEKTGLPVQIENAPTACALAKMWLSSRGNGSDDFVYITLSDGVGTGVVVDGKVIRGRGNTAGEFGHVPVHPDGLRCLCGARGCLEAYTSNLATLGRYLGHEVSPAESQDLVRQSGITIADLLTRARTGDQRAIAAIQETGDYLGLGIITIIHALNPGEIYVGGEITAAWDLIEPRIRLVIAARALTASASSTPIIPEQLGGHPRLRGAAALVAAPMFAAPSVA